MITKYKQGWILFFVLVVVFGISVRSRIKLPKADPGTLSSRELFSMAPSAIGSDELTEWARIQKMKADSMVPLQVTSISVFPELWRLGNTNTMKVMILPTSDADAYVDVAFGGAFHRWGIIIGSTNLTVNSAPRGRAKVIRKCYVIYDTEE